MTGPAPGLTPAFVDWYRLYWALPSPMHEGLRVRALCPTGYKVMRCSPHASSAQSRIKTSCCWLRDFDRPDASTLAPCSPPSRRGLFRAELAASAERRPALTAAARGASRYLWVGTKKRPQAEQRNLLREKFPCRRNRTHNSVHAAQRACCPINFPLDNPHTRGGFSTRPLATDANGERGRV